MSGDESAWLERTSSAVAARNKASSRVASVAGRLSAWLGETAAALPTRAEAVSVRATPRASVVETESSSMGVGSA